MPQMLGQDRADWRERGSVQPSIQHVRKMRSRHGHYGANRGILGTLQPPMYSLEQVLYYASIHLLNERLARRDEIVDWSDHICVIRTEHPLKAEPRGDCGSIATNPMYTSHSPSPPTYK
jgi:hypothetical protein